MTLCFVRHTRDLNSAEYAEELLAVQQQQLLLTFRAVEENDFETLFYAFENLGGYNRADGHYVVDVANPAVLLYDYWEITTSAGGCLFLHDTLTTAGVEMASYDFKAVPAAAAAVRLERAQLAEALQAADWTESPVTPWIFAKDAKGRWALAGLTAYAIVPSTPEEWEKLLFRYDLTEAFVRQYWRHIAPEWRWRMSSSTVLSEEFIREHATELDWADISLHQTLSESFIREFADRVKWGAICVQQTLSEPFIREFADRVKWSKVAAYQQLSDEFVAEFADQIKVRKLDLRQRSEAFVRAHQKALGWKHLSQNGRLSEAFIREFQDKVNWAEIAANQTLSVAFLTEFADRLDWAVLSANQHLSDEVLRAFADRLYWDHLANFGRPLTEAQIREHEERFSAAALDYFISLGRIGPAYRQEINARRAAAQMPE